jgi:predicted LPLAT superfamily acyltransferase
MAYFQLTAGSARKASFDYLSRVRIRQEELGRARAEKLTVYRHFVSFGDAILDKVAMWANRFDGTSIQFSNPAVLDALRAERSGVCFIGSHLGNLELLRAFGATSQSMNVNALVFTRHSQGFMRVLAEVNPQATKRMLEVDDLGPDTLVKLREKIELGEHVAIVGDRTSTRHEERSIRVPFLGSPAAFPEGPFIIAHLLACPVYLIFCLRRNDGYVIHLERFAASIELPRGDRASVLQQTVTRYVQRLEHYCLEAPLQWFNFFDFWQLPERRRMAGK